jgi:hypothetical protein
MEKVKAFFLICAGILMLSVALHLSTRTAVADFDPEAAWPIVAMGDSGSVLLDSGECWIIGQGGWYREPMFDAPIPVSEIAFWNEQVVVATNGDGWLLHGGSEYINIGAPPNGTPAAISNWSQLRGNFAK